MVILTQSYLNVIWPIRIEVFYFATQPPLHRKGLNLVSLPDRNGITNAVCGDRRYVLLRVIKCLSSLGSCRAGCLNPCSNQELQASQELYAGHTEGFSIPRSFS